MFVFHKDSKLRVLSLRILNKSAWDNTVLSTLLKILIFKFLISILFLNKKS